MGYEDKTTTTDLGEAAARGAALAKHVGSGDAARGIVDLLHHIGNSEGSGSPEDALDRIQAAIRKAAETVRDELRADEDFDASVGDRLRDPAYWEDLSS